jgi:hypothetical protein
LAVRGGRLPEVVEALGGRTAGSVSWADGVRRAYREDGVAVGTPLLPGAGGGWLLVAGEWVAARHRLLDVAALSGTLGGEVQLFVTHRVVELHRWERAVDGAVVRSFEYLGERDEVTEWRGEPDIVERAVGLPHSYDPSRDADPGGPPPPSVDEEDVMRVAAAWSVDPSSLDGAPAAAGLTVIRLPRSRGRRWLDRWTRS